MFAAKRKKMRMYDKNAHTCARFAPFFVFWGLFLSNGFS